MQSHVVCWVIIIVVGRFCWRYFSQDTVNSIIGCIVLLIIWGGNINGEGIVDIWCITKSQGRWDISSGHTFGVGSRQKRCHIDIVIWWIIITVRIPTVKYICTIVRIISRGGGYCEPTHCIRQFVIVFWGRRIIVIINQCIFGIREVSGRIW